MTSATPDPSWPAALPLKMDRSAAPDAREVSAAVPTRVSREALAASLRRRPRSNPGVLDRESILLATAACLDEVGYDGTTIRRIARQLGCAVGSIYRYYADKRELLAAVCDWRFEAVRAAAYTASARDFAELYLRVSRERPESYRLMFWLAALSPESDASAMPTVVREIVEAWARRLESHAAAQRLWFHLHGRATLCEDLQPEDLSPQWQTAQPLEDPGRATPAIDAWRKPDDHATLRFVALRNGKGAGVGDRQEPTADEREDATTQTIAAPAASSDPAASAATAAFDPQEASDDSQDADTEDDLTLL